MTMNESRIEMPTYFHVSTGKPSKRIRRLGDFDKPNKAVLEKEGLDALSFNFFVQWEEGYSGGKLVQEVWIKRIVSLKNKKVIGVEDIKNSDVAKKLEELEGKNHIISVVNIMESINIRLRYLMLINKPYPDKMEDQRFIGFFMDYMPKEDRFHYEYLSIKKLTEYIRRFTGVSLRIGKGLKVTETYLEAYLSKTDTPFPGDCDELVFSKEGIEALIEYKKCTKKDALQVKNQSFTRFVQNKDRLKYARLDILRKYINGFSDKEVPLINVLYSVEEKDQTIKLEGVSDKLTLENTRVFEAKETPLENKERLLKTIRRMVRKNDEDENADK